MSWEKHVAGMGGNRNAYKILVGEPEEKRVLGTTRHTWKDNIKRCVKNTVSLYGLH
jgi:hypothetical protein